MRVYLRLSVFKTYIYESNYVNKLLQIHKKPYPYVTFEIYHVFQMHLNLILFPPGEQQNLKILLRIENFILKLLPRWCLVYGSRWQSTRKKSQHFSLSANICQPVLFQQRKMLRKFIIFVFMIHYLKWVVEQIEK